MLRGKVEKVGNKDFINIFPRTLSQKLAESSGTYK